MKGQVFLLVIAILTVYLLTVQKKRLEIAWDALQGKYELKKGGS